MNTDKIKITWIDRRREPQQPANPSYPDGIDVNMSRKGASTCFVALPYPARRVGFFYIECARCGANVVLTTAGRRDDPRSVKIECQRAGLVQ